MDKDSLNRDICGYKVGRKMRLELTTSGTTNQRSNQLSYIRHRIERPILTQFLIKSQVKNIPDNVIGVFTYFDILCNFFFRHPSPQLQ